MLSGTEILSDGLPRVGGAAAGPPPQLARSNDGTISPRLTRRQGNIALHGSEAHRGDPSTLKSVSWVDIVMAAVVVVATDRGLSIGILRQVGSLIGFVTGFVGGTLLAPPLAMKVSNSSGRPIVAVIIVVVCCVIGSVIGRRLGAAANLSLRRLKLGAFDRGGGAAFAAVGSLVACWLVAGMLVNVSFLSLSSAIDHSRILAVLDRVMPPVPSVEARLQALFRTADFPSVFANVVAPSVPSVTTPTPAATARAVRAAAASIVKVTALNACGINREGTGFLLAPGVYVTAAHVVAGSQRINVAGATGRLLVIDIRNDVAVITSRSVGLTTLRTWLYTPAANTPAAVVGYPNDGPRTTTPAAVAGQLTAQSHDIYNNGLFERSLVVVGAQVEPGNSGSPLLVAGEVAGMIFSKSTSDANTAYAVPTSVLRADLSHVRWRVTAKSGPCLSG